jgi:hypothetical protein
MPLFPEATPYDPYQGGTPRLRTAYDVTLLPEDARLGREESVTRFQVDGRVMALYKRSKAGHEDWLVSSIKATLYSADTGEVYRGTPPDRKLRDALLVVEGVI